MNKEFLKSDLDIIKPVAKSNYESNPISIKLLREFDTDRKICTLDNSRQTTILAKQVLDTRKNFSKKKCTHYSPKCQFDHKQRSSYKFQCQLIFMNIPLVREWRSIRQALRSLQSRPWPFIPVSILSLRQSMSSYVLWLPRHLNASYVLLRGWCLINIDETIDHGQWPPNCSTFI